MKKIIIAALISLFTFSTISAEVVREGNTFVTTKKSSTKSEPTKTKFTWKDSKDEVYPIYISSTGSCFVIKKSKKTGKEYRYYLGPELSQKICQELGIEYKSKTKK